MKPDTCPACGALPCDWVNDPSAFASDLLAPFRSFLPKKLCLTNRGIPDDLVLSLDVTMGELRAVAEALARIEAGTGETACGLDAEGTKAGMAPTTASNLREEGQ